jgi:hypothetical protein
MGNAAMTGAIAEEVLELYPEEEQPEPAPFEGTDPALLWRLIEFLADEQLKDTDDLAAWFAQVRADRQELRELITTAGARS